MEIKRINIKDLKPHPKNPRVHPNSAIKKLTRSIKEFGWTNPILVSNDGYVLAGHARLKAAEKAGLKEVPVIYLPLEGTKAEAYMITDNKLQEETDWDEDKLKDLLEELNATDINMEITGFDSKEIDKLISEFSTEIKEDKVPELHEKPTVKYGDIWQLGRHRLMCGDSTNRRDVKKLMNGETADSLITDPPYGVDYAVKNVFLNKMYNGSRLETNIINDNIKEYRKFYREFLDTAILSEYNTVYVFISVRELLNMLLAFQDAGYYMSSILVWVKNNHILSRNDYAFQHEDIIYGWKGKHKFYGEFSSTVIFEDKPIKNDLHPTMKPVKLIAKLINDGSDVGAIIYDPFGGSGTTLIASEQLNRRCYMMEITPEYCDIIVKRWEQFTGEKVVKVDG